MNVRHAFYLTAWASAGGEVRSPLSGPWQRRAIFTGKAEGPARTAADSAAQAFGRRGARGQEGWRVPAHLQALTSSHRRLLTAAHSTEGNGDPAPQGPHVGWGLQ